MKSNIAYILLMVACLLVACSESKDEPTPQPVPQYPSNTTPTPATGSVWSDVPIGFSAVVEDHATTRTALTPVYGPDLTNDDFYTGTGEERHINWGSVTYNANVTATSLNGDTKADGIGFGVYSIYTGNDTYAQAITAAQAAVSGSGDDKRSERQLVMFNQQVTTTDNGVSWDYTPKRFWPGNAANISFFAYAPYKTDGIVYPNGGDAASSSNIDNTKTTEVFSYVKKEDFGVPYINWDHETQQDLLYGVANEDVIDYSMAPFKLAGDDYVDMHRPNDNALHWKLKHALARAKFTISNYMSYEDQLGAEAIAIGGANTQYEKYISGGTYKINPADESEEPKDLNGYYVHLGTEDNPTMWLKYNTDQTTRKVIITDITFRNLNKQGSLYLMNDENKNPIWSIPAIDGKYASYKLIPGNPAIIREGLTSENVAANFAGLPKIGKNAVPLNVAKTGDNTYDDTKDHYILFIPQEYNEEADDNIEIYLKYQVVSYVKLEGRFNWDREPTNPPTYYENQVEERYMVGVEKTLKGVLPVSLEANKSYNIVIQLGKTMKILFEITDWDDTHTIKIPDFI